MAHQDPCREIFPRIVRLAETCILPGFHLNLILEIDATANVYHYNIPWEFKPNVISRHELTACVFYIWKPIIVQQLSLISKCYKYHISSSVQSLYFMPHISSHKQPSDGSQSRRSTFPGHRWPLSSRTLPNRQDQRRPRSPHSPCSGSFSLSEPEYTSVWIFRKILGYLFSYWCQTL